MKRYYSSSTGGFYLDAVNKTMPPDSLEISENFYQSLLGKEIEPDENGLPRVKVPAALTVDQKRAALVSAVTAQRWEVETGGITLPGGTRVLTGKADQDRITSVIVNAQIAGIQSVDFKADSGWVSLSVEGVTAIAAAVAAHVQACFTAERAHHEAIAALDAAGIDTYDINTGWPSAANNP